MANNDSGVNYEKGVCIGIGTDIHKMLEARDTMSFCKKISGDTHSIMKFTDGKIKRTPSEQMKLIFKDGVIL